MAVGKAAMVGAIAAMAIPYVAGRAGDLGELAHRGSVHLPIGDHLYWSWPVFSIVTLFAWAMLAWSNR